MILEKKTTKGKNLLDFKRFCKSNKIKNTKGEKQIKINAHLKKESLFFIRKLIIQFLKGVRPPTSLLCGFVFIKPLVFLVQSTTPDAILLVVYFIFDPFFIEARYRKSWRNQTKIQSAPFLSAKNDWVICYWSIRSIRG